MGKFQPDLERGFRRIELGEQRRFHFGSRLDLEVHLGDNPQCPESADVQLHQVVARDVLHHLAAGTRNFARRVGDRNADHPVAYRAITAPGEPIGVGRDHSADGRPFRMWWIERQALTLRAKRGLQIAKAHPSLHAAGKVGGLVLEQPRHPFG